MEELAASLVIFGRGNLLKTLFDRRVSVKGKSIGLKSISFPNLQSQPIRFKVRIQDRKGDVHIILLPPNRWVRSDDLIFAIFEGLSNLFVDGCYSSKFLRSSARRFLLEILDGRETKDRALNLAQTWLLSRVTASTSSFQDVTAQLVLVILQTELIWK